MLMELASLLSKASMIQLIVQNIQGIGLPWDNFAKILWK